MIDLLDLISLGIYVTLHKVDLKDALKFAWIKVYGETMKVHHLSGNIFVSFFNNAIQKCADASNLDRCILKIFDIWSNWLDLLCWRFHHVIFMYMNEVWTCWYLMANILGYLKHVYFTDLVCNSLFYGLFQDSFFFFFSFGYPFSNLFLFYLNLSKQSL